MPQCPPFLTGTGTFQEQGRSAAEQRSVRPLHPSPAGPWPMAAAGSSSSIPAWHRRRRRGRGDDVTQRGGRQPSPAQPSPAGDAASRRPHSCRSLLGQCGKGPISPRAPQARTWNPQPPSGLDRDPTAPCSARTLMEIPQLRHSPSKFPKLLRQGKAARAEARAAGPGMAALRHCVPEPTAACPQPVS